MENNQPRTERNTDKHGQDNTAQGIFFQSQRGINFPAAGQENVKPTPASLADAPDAPGTQDSQKTGFYIKPFRIISADTFWVWDPNDYAVYLCEFLPDAIKAAAPLFESMPLQKDHRKIVDANIGDIRNTRWSENTPGIVAPGVDGDFRFNEKLDADTAERVRQGHIKCCSAGFWFTYVKSHSDLDTWDFIKFQGQSINGTMVRRIITAITAVEEVSVVLAGADPNAQAIAEMSKIIYETNNKEVNVNLNDIMKNLKAKLAELSGDEVVTDQQAIEALNSISAAMAETNKLKELNTALTLQVANLQTFKAAAEARHVTLQNQVKGILQAQGKTPSALELKSIELATTDELEAMHADLKKEAMANGNFRCPHCNEAITALHSSVTPAPPDASGASGEPGDPGIEKQVLNLSTIHDCI